LEEGLGREPSRDAHDRPGNFPALWTVLPGRVDLTLRGIEVEAADFEKFIDVNRQDHESFPTVVFVPRMGHFYRGKRWTFVMSSDSTSNRYRAGCGTTWPFTLAIEPLTSAAGRRPWRRTIANAHDRLGNFPALWTVLPGRVDLTLRGIEVEAADFEKFIDVNRQDHESFPIWLHAQTSGWVRDRYLGRVEDRVAKRWEARGQRQLPPPLLGCKVPAPRPGAPKHWVLVPEGLERHLKAGNP
jgi:hypothetical protein